MYKRAYIPWRVFIALTVLGFIGSAGVLPYVNQLLRPVAEGFGSSVSFFLIAFVQGLIISTLLSLLGLLIASYTGLGVPAFSRFLQPEIRGVSFTEVYGNTYAPEGKLQGILVPVALGLSVGVAIALLDLFVFTPALTANAVEGGTAGIADPAARPEWWSGLLASFYGGIVEEILLRLFFLNLIVLVLMKITRKERGRPANWQVWTALVASTLIFAAGHLPTVAATGNLSGLMVFRVMALNSAAGIVFGRIFVRRGLLPAMVSHFSADIVLHVIVAALL